MNEVDNQVRTAYKILEYDPIQKSFSAPKYVIRAKDPRLHRITIAEHRFLLPKGSSAQRGATLVGSFSSHQAVEAEGVREESEEQVAELGQSEDEFGVFDQVDLSEDPSGDLGDPSLTKTDLLGTSSQAEMGFKRKPPTSLLDLIEGQPGKDTPGKSQPKLPPPCPSLNLPRLGHLPPHHSYRLHSPNFLLFLSSPIQKGRGLLKVKSPWMGGYPAPLKRKIKPDKLQSN